MTRLVLSATLLACLPGVIQAEYPGLCVPGCAPKKACSPSPGSYLIPHQLCPQTCAPQTCTPQTCAPQWGVRSGDLSCLMKKSPCPLKNACSLKGLKSSCKLKGLACDPFGQCLPQSGQSGCLTRARDGICRLIPGRVKSACRTVCRPQWLTRRNDPCCGIDRVVIHVAPSCQPTCQTTGCQPFGCQQQMMVQQQRVVMMPPMQAVMVPQACGPGVTCGPAACGAGSAYGVSSMSSPVMVIPGPPAASSQAQLSERLRRLEAEVSSLASQVQSQNQRIGQR